jgi:putative lipoic acid-binding regulatory protein
MQTHSDTSGTTGVHVDGWAVPDPAAIYPAECHFRIIVAGDETDERVRQVLAASELASPLSSGRLSAGGRYRSLQVSVRVKDRAELVRLHEGLRAVEGVRMVL